MHRQLVGMRFFHHVGQHHLARLGFFRHHQHVVVRSDAVGILGDLLHRARFEHPVIVVFHPFAVGFLLIGFLPLVVGDQLDQLQIHAHLRFQLGFNPFQFIGVKALQINVVTLAGITILLQHRQHFAGNILAFLLVEPRRFDFRVNTDVFAG
ncbi:hypothetical protein D3C72_1667770 [compost metagenome]